MLIACFILLDLICIIVVPEGAIDVGSLVWAWWSGIRYYPGYVSYKGSKIHVDFYDGDKHLYDLKDAHVTVFPDVPAKVKEVHQGTRVFARFKKPFPYFAGTIKEVDKSRKHFKFYHVKFDDGDEEWVSFYHLRLLPKTAVVGPAEGKSVWFWQLSFIS